MSVLGQINGIKISGVNADGSGEARLELKFSPYSAKFAKVSDVIADKSSTKAQSEAQGTGTVNTVNTALASALKPGTNVSASIAGFPISFSI